VKTPNVQGPSVVGKTVKASDGTWANYPTSFAYRWYRCTGAGTNCALIAGASKSTYDVTTADNGDTLVVVVIASNAAGSAYASSLPSTTCKLSGSFK
jgi:hypothetical protein